MKPEILVLDCDTDFAPPPKGFLRLILAARSESGETERTVVLSFDGICSKPQIDYAKSNGELSEEAMNG